jgi:hypothetical protein
MNGIPAIRESPMSVDPYAFWRAGCAGHPLAMHEGDPQLGFYRRKARYGADDAVAYWREAGDMRCLLNGKMVGDEMALSLWTYVCNRPVGHREYLYRLEHGHWPNENIAVLGHNRAPDDQSIEALQSVLDALHADVRRVLAAGACKSQDEADEASDLANELMEVEKRATELHRAAKAPSIAEGKRIDKAWFPLRDAACGLKERIRHICLTPWLSMRRREAEAATRAALEAGEEAPSVRVAAGSLKRTSALRTVVTAKVDDYPAALNYFASHPEIRELVQRLADRAVRAGVSVPGCARIETEKAV